VHVVRSKEWVAKAYKDSEFLVIWIFVIEFEVRRLVVQNRCGKPIDNIDSSEKCINPIFVGKM
jgi:hypothetical protein